MCVCIFTFDLYTAYENHLIKYTQGMNTSNTSNKQICINKPSYFLSDSGYGFSGTFAHFLGSVWCFYEFVYFTYYM